MKYLSVLLLVLFFNSCGSTKIAEKPSIPNMKSNAPEDLKLEVEVPKMGFSDASDMKVIMNYLASDDLKGRDSGSEGIEMAANFIEGRFKALGIPPYFQSYKDTLSNFKKAAYNVVAVLEGTEPALKDEFIVIGAHYDHLGIVKMKNGDAIANGANDNASGTASVLEIARYFAKEKTNKRSILFVLFSAEEKGLLGSKHLAEKLKTSGMDIYTMINFEMTGVPMKGKDYFVYVTGYRKSNIAKVANTIAGENLVGFLVRAPQYQLFKRSDNYPFYKEFNIPSHTFCTFDFTNFDYYHDVGDEVSEMDFEHMAKVVNKLIPVVEGVTNDPARIVMMNN